MNLILASFLLISCAAFVLGAPRQKVSLYSMDKLSIDNSWSQFKLSHKKNYQNSTNESKRKVHFQNALKKINDHNQKYNNGQVTYTLGVNQFADWTSDEFMSYVNRGLKNKAPQMNSPNVHQVNVSGRATIPSSVDWRTKLNIPIRNQASCGSCWAFSAVFELESFNLLVNGKSTDLSEQNLVDCTYGSYDGCNGGWMDDAYNYIIKNNGINTEAAYPYKSGSTQTWSGSCQFSSANVGAQLTGYNLIPSGSESALVDALANVGPIAVAIYATDAFQYYKSGVLIDTSCPSGSVNHAVNLVGYGTDSTTGQDYYILRNSWGTGWGDGGYMLYARNKNNQCGVASYASYPTIKSSGTVTTTTTPRPANTTVITTTPRPSNTTVITTTPRPANTTTSIPITTTSQKNTTNLPLCNNGSGFYAYSGCKTFYYCSRSLSNYTCGAGNVFDYASQGCWSSSQMSCKLTDYVCQYGTNYYAYPGCVDVYWCSQSISNFTVPTGYLFNVLTLSFVPESSYKCPF